MIILSLRAKDYEIKSVRLFFSLTDWSRMLMLKLYIWENLHESLEEKQNRNFVHLNTPETRFVPYYMLDKHRNVAFENVLSPLSNKFSCEIDSVSCQFPALDKINNVSVSCLWFVPYCIICISKCIHLSSAALNLMFCLNNAGLKLPMIWLPLLCCRNNTAVKKLYWREESPVIKV